MESPPPPPPTSKKKESKEIMGALPETESEKRAQKQPWVPANHSSPVSEDTPTTATPATVFLPARQDTPHQAPRNKEVEHSDTDFNNKHISKPASSLDTNRASAAAKNMQILNVHKELSATIQNSLALTELAVKPPPKSSQTQKTATRKRRAPKAGQTTGRWTEAEHEAFLVGLATHGREWKKVAAQIPTRSSAQVRSHAQKYFAKLQRDQDDNEEKVRSEAASLLSPAVQANVDRILANPELVRMEVEDTMDRLKRRYHQLQRRLHRAEARSASSASISSTSTSSLQNEELIALSVLHGSLPRSGSETNLHKNNKRPRFD